MVSAYLPKAPRFWGYQLVHNYSTYIVAALFVGLSDRSQNAATGGLIAQVTSGSSRVEARARLRSVTNIGVSLGALLGGIALQIGTSSAFRMLLLTDAGVCYLAALLVLPIKINQARVTPARKTRKHILPDSRYLIVSGINAVISLHFDLVSYLLPIWVSLRTDAPGAIASIAVIIDTAVVVLFQVPVSKKFSYLSSLEKRCR